MKKQHSQKYIIGLIIFFIIASIISKSILMCRLTVVLIALLCLILSKAERYTVNPMILFLITPISLFIYMNLGDVYMVTLTAETWIIAIINMFAFVIAYKVTPCYISHCSCISNTSRNALAKQAILFYLISLLGYVIPFLQSILWIFAIPSIVCALKSKKKAMKAFVVFIFLITAFGMASKSMMLTYCITFIICYEKYYVTDERKRKWVKWGLGLGVFFMIFAFSFANKDRGNYDADEGVEMYTDRGMKWEYSASLFMPYMYITNGWTNLQYVMETQNERTYGLWTLKPLLGYVQLKDNFEKNYDITTYSSFNTCAYMTYGFKDFGYWGSVIMSLFLGFFVKRVYSRYRMSRSPYDIASYILVAQATLELFFSNHFFTQSYPFTIVILMYIVKYFVKNGKYTIETENKQ